MNRRAAIRQMAILFLITASLAQAQQPAKSHRIGILIAASMASYSARLEVFRQRLREHGYVEGKNLVIEYRSAGGKREQLLDLAAELDRLKVDVVVTTGGRTPLVAKKLSAAMPIIFVGAADPVGDGLVSSLARPGGNITGLSNMAADLDGKRLELLKEGFPKFARVGFLWVRGAIRGSLPLTEMESVAKALRLKLLPLEVRSPDDFDSAFTRAKRESIQALITYPNPLITNQQRQVLDFAAKNLLPAMYPNSQFVEAGGLMSYGPNLTDQWRRAADFLDKILKGTKPADIPVEQPTKFEFVVNLKTAKQIGVTIPQWTLMKADRVIK